MALSRVSFRLVMRAVSSAVMALSVEEVFPKSDLRMVAEEDSRPDITLEREVAMERRLEDLSSRLYLVRAVFRFLERREMRSIGPLVLAAGRLPIMEPMTIMSTASMRPPTTK